jgi:superoxide dismutase, Fe-Mn family
MKKFVSTRLAPVLSMALTLVILSTSYINAAPLREYPFKLPPLPYSYDALEPYIDAQTMKVHHQGHHAKYVEELNNAISKYPDLQDKSLVELLTSLNKLPQDIRETVRNNGGGHFNHSFFWTIMGKDKGGQPKGTLKDDINKTFGSFEEFKKSFRTAGTELFGSGWVWLVQDKDNKLRIVTTRNQDSPIMLGIKPILGLDVWEHAYYLKYQNQRGKYIDNWWNVVNWDAVESYYKK